MFELQGDKYFLKVCRFELLAVSWNEEICRLIDKEIVCYLAGTQ